MFFDPFGFDDAIQVGHLTDDEVDMLGSVLDDEGRSRTVAFGDLREGQRVELHPATDAWMRGDRFGTVKLIGRRFVYVKGDSGLMHQVSARDIVAIID